jgi:uncharacterized protein YbaR (Trm112 family)
MSRFNDIDELFIIKETAHQRQIDWLEQVFIRTEEVAEEVYCDVCGTHYDVEDPCIQH